MSPIKKKAKKFDTNLTEAEFKSKVISALRQLSNKLCITCLIEKPLFNFTLRTDTWKYRNDCIICKSAKKKIRRDKNKEIVNKKNREYKKRDRTKEICRLNNSKRRALKRTTEDWTITILSTKELLDNQWWVCNYCWLDINKRTARHLDHIIPLCKKWTHSINNVQWLCQRCNLIKWTTIYE